ncbi:hypothetical protein C8Q75DRAFT_793068 [Abortiporus biennis]|nr:hypothetical protein C8Q75DRAFT_793068 [Abortiporus biennis]
MSVSGFLSTDPNAQRHPPSSPLSNRAPGSGSGYTPFKAPAHKHAHHLHSIPPREKSTRTLIIDHLLWVHARTRFAQARAELGMTDRTGGPSSTNHVHRDRPENYEEEEEVYSDGEDVSALVARAGGPGHTHEEDDDERLESQDLPLARNLRQRAESVEKVITAMLDQPPEVPPVHPDDLLDPPTSPQLHPLHSRTHQHTLPNGVRLRLALATVINDLFARRAPAPPHRQYYGVSSGSPPPSLPSALVPLAAVSLPHQPRPNTRRPMPSDYIRSLYAIGADPDTQNSPPSLRCPRHLHMGCEICVEAKIPARQGPKGRGSTGRTASTPTGSSPGDGSTVGYSGGNVFGLGGGVTGWQEGSGIGSGLARPGKRGTVLRRPSEAFIQAPASGSSSGHGGDGRGGGNGQAMANTKLAETVIRFLRLSALVAMELGREATEDRASVDGGRDDEHPGLATPRPPSLSPLAVFKDLRPPAVRHLAPDLNLHANALRPTREWYFLLAGLLTRTVLEGYITGGWLGVEPLEVLLGVGLGLSPAPEGMLSGASNPNPIPGINTPVGSAKPKNSDPFSEFDPDDLPELDDAVRILFPTLREVNFMTAGNSSSYPKKDGAELDYEIEMTDRLARFYDVPSSTPDIATHMEDLAWQFPAEAVERAACRFSEAVSRWRGKPELETYKKASWITASKDAQGSGSNIAAMSIDSLVHSNPASPTRPPAIVAGMADQRPTTLQSTSFVDNKSRRPTIEKYFSMPPSLMLQGRKRRRSEVERPDDSRRVPTQMFS